MTENTIFRVGKETGTYADIFAATGVAALLESGTATGSPRIVDADMHFEVSVDDLGVLERVAQSPGYPYLQAKTETIPSSVYDRVSYLEQRTRVAAFNEARQAIRAAGGRVVDPSLQQLMDANRPRSDWRQLQTLNVLQGFRNTNRVHQILVELDALPFRDTVRAGLAAVDESRQSGIDWKTSSVQLFNPNAAKGYGLLKPSGTDRNNKAKEQWTDSFVEWLRYRGYFEVACPFFIGNRGEHIRILAPSPADISIGALRGVCSELRQVQIFGSPPKVDARAVIALARLLIDHSEFSSDVAGIPDELRIVLAKSSPAHAISGVAITHFQSLGQARAVSQLQTLSLPDWFPIRTADDASAWRIILDEHDRVLRTLRDDRSDEIGLLVAYRAFLERRGRAALGKLLDFMGGYGAYLPGARDRGRHLPSLSTLSLRHLVEGLVGEYVAILDDPGFQSVAGAIRRATVSAQTLKSRGQDHREIRYDLLHDIRRKRSLAGSVPLIELLCDFIAAYNYENARRREMGKRTPRNVTTEELTGLTGLIEGYGAPLVGAMLAAYGSCRLPYETETGSDAGDTDADEPEPTVGDTDTTDEGK